MKILEIHIFETEHLKEYSRLIYIHATLSLAKKVKHVETFEASVGMGFIRGVAVCQVRKVHFNLTKPFDFALDQW